MNSKPNILIFMTDQERWDVSTSKNICKTPNLDKLIDNGVIFNNCFTTTGHCCPSRASFMTSLYPSQHGIFNNVANRSVLGSEFGKTGLSKDCDTFSQKLKKSGYDLYYCGKWHVSATENPNDRDWEEVNPTFIMKGLNLENYGKIDQWQNNKIYDKTDNRKEGEILRPGWGVYRLFGNYRTDISGEPVLEDVLMKRGYEKIQTDYNVLEGAIDKLDSIRSLGDNKPWCMYIGMIGPHEPLIIPSEYYEMYDINDIKIPDNYYDEMIDKPDYYANMKKRWSQLSEEEIKKSIAHYYGYCTMLDDMLGVVIKKLEDNNELDNTVIIFTSDHGEMLGSHGIYCKGAWSFDENFNIPLVISWKNGIKNPGREVNDLTSIMDIAPTIVDISQSDKLTKQAGISLVPALMDEIDRDTRKSLYLQCNGVEAYITQRIIRTEKYKLVYSPFLKNELYDLEKDPSEMINCYYNDEFAEIKKGLYKELWEKAAESEDHYIANEYVTISLAEYGPLYSVDVR